MNVYHYTTQQRFDEIEADGLIRLATAGVPANEKPVVWFTVSDEWDETTGKGMTVTYEGKSLSITQSKLMTHHLGNGLVRITCDEAAAPDDWKDFKRKSGIHRDMARGLFQAAMNCSAKPSDWRVFFEPVPREAWLAVDFWDGCGWLPERPVVDSFSEDQLTKLVAEQIKSGRYVLLQGID